MNKINENQTWLNQNFYSLNEAQFLQFQQKTGELFSKAVRGGQGITINEARKQAIAWFL